MIQKRGEMKWFHGEILPGIFPDRIFDLMVDRFVDEELGLCKLCDVDGDRCHVLEEIAPHTVRKLCPILFHDAVKPSEWKVSDVL